MSCGNWILRLGTRSTRQRARAGGRGWLLSDYDTWHRCRTHGDGVPHLEDETGFNSAAHSLAMWRQAYETFRNMAIRAGFKGNFKDACLGLLPKNDHTPKAWVEAAETLATESSHWAEEAQARRFGFSCALEMRWAEEAQIERAEREQFLGWVN